MPSVIRLSVLESRKWCREGESNPHSPFGPADFKSAASANFAIPAGMKLLKILHQFTVLRFNGGRSVLRISLVCHGFVASLVHPPAPGRTSEIDNLAGSNGKSSPDLARMQSVKMVSRLG